MNKFIAIGNLVRDPESFTTQSGVSYTKFTIAINRPFSDSSGNRVADYFDIIAWRQLGDRCAKYLYKGSRIGVTGSIQQQRYEDRDGNKRTSYQVVADEVEFLSSKPQGSNSSADTRQPNNANRNSSQPQSLLDSMQEVSPDGLPF